jgi:pimeloyl-ACP methyl ester carboxylesterase
MFLGPAHPLLAVALFGLIQPIMPLAHSAYGRFAGLMPEGDRKVFADPEIEGMFIDDIVDASRTQFSTLANDITLFVRDWGFRLRDVRAPLRWWHGDADNFVPLAAAEHAVDLMPNAALHLRPDESHLGGFGVADEVLEVIDRLWT